MKKLDLLPTLILFACASAYPGPQTETVVELVVPNFDIDSPACHVRVQVKTEKCGDESCELPAPEGSATGPVQLHFSCLPTSAPTGFENPPAYAKVQSIRTKANKGHISVIDDIAAAPGVRQRELNFCLYGKQATFCGNAKTSQFDHRKRKSSTDEIIALIKRMELIDAPLKGNARIFNGR